MKMKAMASRLLTAYQAIKGTLFICLTISIGYLFLFMLVSYFRVSTADFLISVPLTKEGQLWRSVPSLLFHANWVHFLSNLLGIILLGPFIERRMGAFGFVVAFIVIGFASDLIYAYLLGPVIEAYLGPVAYVSTVLGASSAVMGLIPLALMTAAIKAPPMSKFKRVLFGVIIYFLVLSSLPFWSEGIEEQVSDLCHLAGLLSGIFVSVAILVGAFFQKLKKQDRWHDKKMDTPCH
ncbi:hypothetical protein BVJ53_00280 [Lacticaseibacillus chiayiensis]|uniref:Rhomboid family intramembrane serine protease n=1 Tax=Lacticaseibacillus chiayiensis TaxID=2100821 RepID=A0A4Q1UI58_9LACO|nr:rhomboid family intramembrane serine protease [Lacticaseibacillus chiayiensis]RXT30688.1 hypothetical protein BVJ53_00280 [Lacticaseibacillus chiayiensis]UYN56354.1 rhomboid family intramembrane serine protease [Lacticaseibacillus chiayiensis]